MRHPMFMSRVFVRIVIVVLTAFCFVRVAMAENSQIELSLDFSLDGGKTFVPEANVTAGTVVLVRASWDYLRTDGCNYPYLYTVRRESGDFASANVGMKRWNGRKAWYQKNQPYYVKASRSSVIIKIDTGKRAEGVVGYMNKWDKKTRKFVNGPLPACEALAGGASKFIFSVYYYRKNLKPKKISGEKEFTITISKKGAASLSIPKKGITERKHFVELKVVNPDSKYIFKTKNLLNLATKQSLGLSGEMVKILSDYSGWLVGDDVPANKYFLSWKIQSGWGSGMETLDAAKPFLYLNGKPLHFVWAKGPRKSGLYFVTVARTAKPVSIKPGDHLRISKFIKRKYIGNLDLSLVAPEGFPIRIRHFADYLADNGISLQCVVVSQTDDSAKIEAVIRNITNKKMKCVVKFSGLDYWRANVAEKKVDVTLDPYKPERIVFNLPMKTLSPGFSATIAVLAAKNGIQTRESVDLFHSFNTPYRSLKWLNKGWREYNVPKGFDTSTPPSNVKEAKVDLPTMYYFKRDVTRLFINSFTIDKKLKNCDIMLHSAGAGDVLSLFLNGKKMLDNAVEKGTPFQLDLTDVTVPGVNSITIITRPGNKLPLRDIYLEVVPQAHIQRVFVSPSFRKKEIVLKVFRMGGSGISIQGELLHNGKKVLDIPTFQFKGDIAEKTIPWSDPILWDTSDPELLELVLSMKNSKDAIVDVKRVRFGFREIWVDGFNVYVNGIPRRFKAIAMNGGYSWASMQPSAIRKSIRLKKKSGIDFLRHVYQGDTYAGIADEEGVLMAQGVQTIAHPTVNRILDDKLWSEKDRLSIITVKALFNHPSIVEWYISNEFTETMQGENLQLARKRVWASRNAINEVDSSRLFGHGCDLDVGGRNSFYSTHYPVDGTALRTIDAYTPAACLWRMPKEQFTKGLMVPCGIVKNVANVHPKSPIKWGTKPIFVGEFGWNMFYNPPGGYMQIFGDKVLSSVWAMENAHARINAMFNAGHRDAEVSLYTTWTHSASDFYRFVPKIDIYLWNQSSAWYGGSSITIPFDIFYDSLKKNECRFRATLELGGTEQIVSNIKLSLNPTEVYRGSLTVATPDVSKIENAVLRCELLTENGIVASRIRKVRIYPRSGSLKISTDFQSTLLIYDPDNSLDKRLNGISTSNGPLKTRKISNLSELKGIVASPLVVAEKALNNASEGDIDAIDAFTVKGSRVLVLRQKRVHGLFNMNVTPKISSIAFVRAPNDSVLREFSDADFKYWNDGAVVSRHDYIKPKKTPGISLLDTASGMGGMEYTPLYKLSVGKGGAYLCQMVLEESYGRSPVADKLFLALLKGVMTNSAPKKKLGVFLAKGGVLKGFLEKLKLKIVFAKSLSEYDSIFCDAILLTDNAFEAKLRTYIADGGVVYLKNVDFSTRKSISALIGRELRFAANNMRSFKGRELFLKRDSVLDGLSQEDFYWRRWQEHENTKGSMRGKKDLIGDVCTLLGDVDGGEQLLYPGGLLKVNVGKGVVYIDTLFWEKSSPLLKRKTRRIAMNILGNLGGRFAFNRAPALDMGKVSFESIDLTPVFNRGCVDDKEDDGIGSWNDQGPKLDMRKLKSGRLTFGGIPFSLEAGGKCVALRSKFRKSDLPTEVSIPINKKVRGLAFLQTSAWTGSQKHGSYVIHYKDGSTSVVTLSGGVTLRDWMAPTAKAPFPSDNEVSTEYAISCSTGVGRDASLFKLLWINPHPFSEVDHISFKSENKAILALFAVTELVDKSAASATSSVESAADKAKAAKLIAKGMAVYRKGDHVAAGKYFETAISAGTKDASPYLLLADIHAAAKEYHKAEMILLKLISLDPGELESYTKLGSIYEKQGKLREALEIYRKSVKVDKNQPWLMHSIERLKKKLEK